MEDKIVFIRYDAKTKKWFQSHPDSETTVMQCADCNLFYKPSLGHVGCKKKPKDTKAK